MHRCCCGNTVTDVTATLILTNAIFSCLSGDDSSTCIPITANNVEIVASQDSSINSKARGSNKVGQRTVSEKRVL